MTPKQLHDESKRYAFEARQAMDRGDDQEAFDYYAKAADFESQAARFYFDRPDLEPTRSIIIRSAAFLNLKAGLIDEAQQFIFRGLLDTQDSETREQLNNALEMSIVLKNVDTENAGYNVEYFKRLRQRSVYYTLESKESKFSTAVSMEMIRDFTNDYLHSFKAFAAARFNQIVSTLTKVPKDIHAAARQFEDLAAPLFTNTSIGSFKFSIANDFLQRTGEDPQITRLKADVLLQYHENIFINPLDDSQIERFKNEFPSEDLDRIFRPITRIKSNRATYKVAYFDNDTYYKKYLTRISSDQKKKLLPLIEETQENIGILESSIIHARDLGAGRKTRSVIQSQQLQSYEFNERIRQVEPKDRRPLILREEIVITVFFDIEKGFTFTYDDLDITVTDTDFARGKQHLHHTIYLRIEETVNAKPNAKISPEWKKVIDRLLNNPDSLKK
jgi:hypothetical protein